MTTAPTRFSWHQSATAWATNSGPLSNLIKAGIWPRSIAMRANVSTIRTDRVINHDGEALAAELVDDVEHLHLAAINGVIELEIHGP